MVAIHGQLELTDLVCSIDGLSSVGAAAILAETGDRSRFPSARAISSAGQASRTRPAGAAVRHLRRQGPPVRCGTPAAAGATWRAVWGCLPNNRVHAAPLPAPDQP
jgi:hypothetical protein